MDIEKELQENRKLIDSIIESKFPKNIDSNYLKWLAGDASYLYDPEVIQKTVFDPMWDLLSRGGKRWRPWLFLILANNLGVDLDKFTDLVTIVELLHNGSLVADDIEDGADMRRGDKAIHLKYGLDIAVNLSSAMYFMPLRILMEMDVDKDIYRRLVDAYIEDMIRIHLGQATDIGWHRGLKDPESIKVEHYLQMCANKTGVLPRLAARFAAILAQLSPEDEAKIGKFAESIGIAFQIQDDIINVTGAEKLGKSFGEDITEGKITLMVIYTLSRASEEDKRRLKEILGMHTRDRALIEEAISILNKYGSIEYAKEFARDIVRRSWKDVESILPDNEYKERLRSLANFMVEREF